MQKYVSFICRSLVMMSYMGTVFVRCSRQDSTKASRNLQKLQLFRRFYIMVIAYVYFTRIVVLLLGMSTIDIHSTFNELLYVWISCTSGHNSVLLALARRPIYGAGYPDLLCSLRLPVSSSC
jgi:hypothetical protein